jgi:hypothetical protein
MPQKTIDQKIEKLARMVEKGFEGVHGEIKSLHGEIEGVRGEVKGLREEFKGEIRSVRKDFRETEERLLFAIENTEVKKRDFDALAGEVKEVEKRVGVLEKAD